MRESTKYEHVVAFAEALPAIREKVREHMALRGLPREKVLATVVHLLETTLIRVGNDDYAKQNNSYGLTTLKNRHVSVDGNEVRFRFTGKSGKQWSLRVRDRRIAKIIKACQDLPGQELLQYVDEAGNFQDVTSFLSSSSSVALKNFSSSCCMGFERSRTCFRACSECESLGTANRRSLRSVFPLLFCSI